MTFQISEEDTKNILNLLRESRSPNPQTNQIVQKQLESYNLMQNFNCYLAFILGNMKQEPEEIRCVAGLLLKNNLNNYFPHLASSLKYIQTTLLQTLLDSSRQVRNTSSNCIATCTRRGSLTCWLQNEINIIECLCQLLDSGNNEGVDGALATLVKICEDCCDQLDSDAFGRPVNILIPKLINFFGHWDETARKNALHSIVSLWQNNHYEESGSFKAISSNMDAFLQGIFSLANDQNKLIRKDVCRAFTCLLDNYMQIKPFMQNIITYMLVQTQDSDESLAFEATEFWSAIAEMEIAIPDLSPFIGQLIPVLLNGMVYSELERSMLGGDEDDTHVADRESSIHPHMINKSAKAKIHSVQGGAHDGEEEEDTDNDDPEVAEWNLRKCSASSLDVLSTMYGDRLLEILLPLLQTRMQDPKWEVRESAVLALGAIAEGCFNGMRQHLSTLIPYLISILHTEPKPLVRSIACWTLSRYSRWVVSQSTSDPKKYFEPMLEALLVRILDRNKKVQEASCSAFATFEEEAQSDVIPYLRPILECLVKAFDMYQAKNLLILYDAVVTLSDAVGRKLNNAEYIQLLMPPLIAKWKVIKDDDRGLLPLLACLTSVSQAVGPGFLPFAEGVFQRCVSLIQRYFQLRDLAAQNNTVEVSDREFVVCALDLLSGLADGLESAIEPFVAQSPLLDLLGECLKDPSSELRQSSFAFVGDLAKTCMPHVKPRLQQYMPLLINNLNPHPVSVCNNASWAIGEIAIRIQSDIDPWVLQIIDRLIPIMNQNLNRNLLENTGITLGRLGLVCPNRLAPRIQEFIQPWCFHLRNIRNDVEKEHAFLGLCQMIRQNPSGVFSHFGYICNAFSSWGTPKKELKDEFSFILRGFRQHLGEQWPAYFNQFPQVLKNHLSEVYGLRGTVGE